MSAGKRQIPVVIPTYDLYGEHHEKRSDFWLHCETIAVRSSAHRWEIGLHRHESFQQFLYIRNGVGDAVFGTASSPLRPPCVVAVPPGVSHGFRFSQDIDGLVITFVAERLQVTARHARQPGDWLSEPCVVALPPGEDARYLDETFARLFSEFSAQRAGRANLIEAHLNAAIIIAGRLAGIHHDTRETNLARVETVKELISLHFREKWPASAYAAELNLSPTHLNRVVRDVTGMSLHDLIMERFVDEARRALVFTASNVQQVADSLGFTDAAYFARCFRKRTGQTPRAYREAERSRMNEMGG